MPDPNRRRPPPPARRDRVDEAVEESFPASDPPGWSGLRVGAPRGEPPPGGAPATPVGTPDA